MLLVVLLLSAGGAPTAAAQEGPAGETLDERLLLAVYSVDSPAFVTYAKSADWLAYPVIIGAPVGMWAGAAAAWDAGTARAAYRLTLTEAAALAASLAAKITARRSRPYVRFPQIRERSIDRPFLSDDASLPSGHSTMSFALLTSVGLSYPYWYVLAPGAVWATGVALSRVWLGVHYPSDVLLGALLGSGTGVLVHLLQDLLTPAFLEDASDAATPAPALRLVMPL